MRALRFVPVMLSIAFATAAAAGDFDGALPLTCAVAQGHDCLATKSSCDATTHEKGATSTVDIDFTKKQIRSPYKKALLPVHHTSTNNDSLVLQGGDLFVVWNALVDRKTGALTITLADSTAAYVYFGTCKVAGKH